MEEHCRMTSRDLVQDNIDAVGRLFPSCLKEVKGEDGAVSQKIDFEVLKQELSRSVIQGRPERYEFNWPGKRAAALLANTPIEATLRPCRKESVNFDTTENLYIEGDNLDVLKLLCDNYRGKIKMIYIDPPYNTGNDFVYEDDFAQSEGEYRTISGDYDDQGNRLVKNSDSSGRFHTDWLNMIYPRLKIAQKLLAADDGVIFISIDDNEVANLKKVCDEVFGASHFIADISWQRTYSPRNDSKGIVSEVEHLVVYARNEDWQPNKLPRTEEMNALYKNPDNDVSEWRSDNPFAPGASTHQGMVYAIQHPFTGKMIYPVKTRCWCYQQSDVLSIMQGWCHYELKDIHDEAQRAEICGISADKVRADVQAIVLSEPLEVAREKAQQVYDRGHWPKFYFTQGGQGGICRKTYLDQVAGRLPTNFWSYSEVGHTDEAKKEIKALFDGQAPFDTPKPVRLIDRMLTIATDKESLVLDFFSGSATTAHAIMKKNAEDGGHRRFILVQVPEQSPSPEYKTICEIGKERIRRAGRKIAEENAVTAPNLDVGFRVLKLDSSNMEDVYYRPSELTQEMLGFQEDNVKSGRTAEDLLFQVMLEKDIPLSSRIETETVSGKTIFNVADGYMLACFDTGVTDEVVTAIARKKPVHAVFRDAGMASDSTAINFEQLFATYSPDTKRSII